MSDLNREHNITAFSSLFRLNRATVRKRLKEANVQPCREVSGNPVYDIADAAEACFSEVKTYRGEDPDEMSPMDRRAWYQSEMERVKLEEKCGNLCPVEDVGRVATTMMMGVVNPLDSVVDTLERKCGLNPDALEVVQEVIDQTRENLYQRSQRISEDLAGDSPEDEP